MKKKFRLVLDLKPHIGGQVKLEEPEMPVISFLLNCYYYFFQCVFIVKDGLGYRLVVNHRGRVLTNRDYRTLRGAKAAFTRLYGDKAWQKDTKSIWSHFYPPEKQWLKKKMAGKTVGARHQALHE